MDLHYSQTRKRARKQWTKFHYLMDLHYSQTYLLYSLAPKSFTTLWIYTILKQLWMNRNFYTVSLPYGFTLFSNFVMGEDENAIVSLPYGFTLFSNKKHGQVVAVWFHYLMDLHYSQTQCGMSLTADTFHYLMDLHYSQIRMKRKKGVIRFTTLWIYTILKSQISCAHYTAQGKSTRSSTIVLWRNGIVKGAQIPIQHIEFGAHIYARRCLAL